MGDSMTLMTGYDRLHPTPSGPGPSTTKLASSKNPSTWGASVTFTATVTGSSPTGTVSFAAGEVTKTISINVVGDTAVESDETFNLTLSGATNGATITSGTATATILNDDVNQLERFLKAMRELG